MRPERTRLRLLHTKAGLSTIDNEDLIIKTSEGSPDIMGIGAASTVGCHPKNQIDTYYREDEGR